MPKPKKNEAADDTVSGSTVESLIVPDLQAGKAYLIVIKGRSVGRMLELGAQPAVIGRGLETDLPVDDEAVSREHARVERTGGGFEIVDQNSTNGLFVNNERTQRHRLEDGDRIQIGNATIVKFAYQDVVEESFQKHLYHSATRDPLVSTYNRQFFLDSLDAEFSLCFRSRMPLSLLMLDIDHFKRVNDTYGHLTGDQALREVAAVIQKTLRSEDILARYGGEEFVVILRYPEPERAFTAAERVRHNVESLVIEHERARFSVTVSIGLATLLNKCYSSPVELLREADENLYTAKRLGRNMTVSSETAREARAAGKEPARDEQTTRERTMSIPRNAANQAVDEATAAGESAEDPTKKHRVPGRTPPSE
jgi:diguanylate cyclase (GGDEF)-like protein